MATEVSEIHTLVERWGEQVGGNYVASILGQSRLFVVDIQEVPNKTLFWRHNPMWDDWSDFTQSRPLYGDISPLRSSYMGLYPQNARI